MMYTHVMWCCFYTFDMFGRGQNMAVFAGRANTWLQEEYSKLLVMSQRVKIKLISAQQSDPKEVKYGLHLWSSFRFSQNVLLQQA